jgi:hypothetical protein
MIQPGDAVVIHLVGLVCGWPIMEKRVDEVLPGGMIRVGKLFFRPITGKLLAPGEYIPWNETGPSTPEVQL